MRHIKSMNESMTAVDKLQDELALACLKEINGGLDLKIFKVKTRAAIVEELVDNMLQNEKMFSAESKALYRRNKTQLVKQIIKDIMS